MMNDGVQIYSEEDGVQIHLHSEEDGVLNNKTLKDVEKTNEELSKTNRGSSFEEKWTHLLCSFGKCRIFWTTRAQSPNEWNKIYIQINETLCLNEMKQMKLHA